MHASHAALADGAHQLFLKNGHMPQQSVYLANALVPENTRAAGTDQQRDGAQSELTIRYLVDATHAGMSPAWRRQPGLWQFAMLQRCHCGQAQA